MIGPNKAFFKIKIQKINKNCLKRNLMILYTGILYIGKNIIKIVINGNSFFIVKIGQGYNGKLKANINKYLQWFILLQNQFIGFWR